MKYLLTISFLVMLSFTPVKKKKVIFFGDSITQAGANPGGYIRLMDTLIQQEGKAGQYELTGAGIGGNKVYDLYLRMEKDVLDKNPDMVVIYIGINDVWHKTSSGTGTDLNKFEQFYKAIIEKLKARDISVILCTPTVIGEKTDNSNPQDGDLNEYSKTIRRLAREYALPLCDLRQLFAEALKAFNPANAERGIYTTDRVHLNPSGNMLVAKQLWEVIKQVQ
ncbi:MAG TPA: SGNH/GDSL hydrolase family protein [Chitinophagaceae bacterium]|mgnify:CR=1 FL=1|nr:SGNH/GDSL hydrolase family protein [Chitinophagaceae bacterium]